MERIKNEIPIILEEKGALNSEGKLKSEFMDSIKGKANMNEAGFEIFVDARVEAQEVHSYLNDYWNYLNHIEYDGHVYAAYFHLAGMDDLNYSVFKFRKSEWQNQERILNEKRSPLSDNLIHDETEFQKKGYTMVILNYDEGPKNHDNLKLHVKHDLLVFERGNLMHSLYDLKSGELLINEINPWIHARKANHEEKVDKRILNDWVNTNLHEKIKNNLATIAEKRSGN